MYKILFVTANAQNGIKSNNIYFIADIYSNIFREYFFFTLKIHYMFWY